MVMWLFKLGKCGYVITYSKFVAIKKWLCGYSMLGNVVI